MSENDAEFIEIMMQDGDWQPGSRMHRLALLARRGADAADRIEQLEDENARLREWNAEIALNAREFVAEIERLQTALRPLACTCKAAHQADCSRSEVDCPFWTARAALDAPA